MEEYIKLLDLPDEFDLADLKKAYRKKVLQYHPDKAANEAERIGFEATMKKLNEANAYIKEYLENHGGKYSKSEYYNTNNSSDDTAEDNTTDDNTYSDEDTEEEPYEDEEESEDTEEEEKNPYDYIKDLSVFEQIIEMLKIMLNPKRLYEAYLYAKQNPQKQQLSLKGNIVGVIVGACLCFFICSFLWNDDTNNTSLQQTAQQEQNKDVVFDNTSVIGRYIADAQQRTVNNWNLPSGELPESIRAKVRFKVFKDGNIIGEPTIKESSGDYSVDKSCLRAVINTAPFKPIPDELNKDYLDVELSFEADKKQ